MNLKTRYERLRRHAGLIDLSRRRKLQVRGSDRLTFLQSMISNDILQLDEASGCYSTFLTPRGRMVSDFYVYRLPDFLMIDLADDLAEKTRSGLNRFIVMDEVEIHDVSGDWGHLALLGPESSGILERTLSTVLPTADLQILPVSIDEDAAFVIRKNELDRVGYELLLPPRQVRPVKKSLLREDCVLDVDAELLQVLRLEAGMPLFGVDMGEENYPVEARLERAISYTKGCYVGQEVVSKATFVGGVRRYLCRMCIAGEIVPEPGVPIFSLEGEEAGSITSSAWSVRLNQPIALGFVKRDCAGDGTSLTLRSAEGAVRATVVPDFGGQ